VIQKYPKKDYENYSVLNPFLESAIFLEDREEKQFPKGVVLQFLIHSLKVEDPQIHISANISYKRHKCYIWRKTF